MVGTGARRQQDHRGLDRSLVTFGVSDDHGSVRAETRITLDQLDTVPLQVLPDRRRHRRYHLAHASPESIHQEIGRERDPDAVDLALRPAC